MPLQGVQHRRRRPRLTPCEAGERLVDRRQLVKQRVELRRHLRQPRFVGGRVVLGFGGRPVGEQRLSVGTHDAVGLGSGVRGLPEARPELTQRNKFDVDLIFQSSCLKYFIRLA